ncbi:MAG: VWA domain-containing protein, partial [Phycisphaerales bacterium]|nr:VWA domain-containing protein [Phycisphaerales bacterium]
MTLLAPWAAVIAAGIGVPALLALYFLRLRRATLRVGSTMLWEGAAKDLEVNVPWKMIRPSWLLALQLLALLCLCIALGRPAVDMDGGAPPRVVVLIDRSASMSAADVRVTAAGGAGGAMMTRLAMAQRKGREIVEASWRTAGSRVAVASFASSAMVHANWSRDRRMLSETIDQLTPTDQPGDVGSAVDLLRALAADSAAEDARVREAELGTADDAPDAGRITVFVLSDGGFDGGRLAEVAGQIGAGRRVDVRFVRVGPEGAGTALAADREIGNVGIVSASARRDFDDPGVVRVTARLTSTFGTPVRRTVRVALGREAGETVTETITIPARTAQGEPGDAVVSMAIGDRGARDGTASADDARLLRVWITEPDVLAADDRAAMMIAPAEKPRVVLVTADREGAAFLRAFLDLTAASPLEVIDPMAYRTRTARGAAGWAGVDLVVLDRVEWGERPPAVATISIGAGGDGVRLVRPAGSGAGPSASRGQRAVTWRRDHPVMRDVDLGSVEFFAPATLPIDAPMLDTATVLVEGVRGPLISAMQDGGGSGAGTSGVRRVLIAPDLARTTWGADVSFVIFMANAVDWLTLKGQGRAAT